MGRIDQAKFGGFVSELRKQKGFTQQELAERLFVSNKAVSKWERGLSLPDISLLTPLAEMLGVTVPELLKGERLEDAQINDCEAETLVAAATHMSEEEKQCRQDHRKRWQRRWAVLTLVALGAVGLTLCLGVRAEDLAVGVLTVEALCLIFGFWACFFAKETLPAFYDREKLSFYSQGVFRMNLPGVRFNNSNWPHILEAMRWWCSVTPVVYPLLWLALRGVLMPVFGAMWELPLCLFASLGLFLPVMAAGKKYE